MIDYQLALQTGAPIPIPECQLVAHQPTIYEISMCGEEEYLSAIPLIGVGIDQLELQDKSGLNNINNFQIFMTAMLDERFKSQRSSFIKVLGLVFPNYKVSFTPNSIFLKKDDQRIVVDKDNFDVFRQVLIDIFCLRSGQGAQEKFNPKGKRAREIAKTIMKNRQKVAAQKKAEEGSILGQQVSCLAIGQKLPLTIVTRYTMYQLLDQVQRYQLYTSWYLDIKSRLAGAKPEKELENWMKFLH